MKYRIVCDRSNTNYRDLSLFDATELVKTLTAQMQNQMGMVPAGSELHVKIQAHLRSLSIEVQA